MAVPAENSKIVVPSMQSLFHLALVKVALPFLQSPVALSTLTKAFAEIQHINSTESVEDSDEIDDVKYKRVKEMLLDIPVHLINCVLKAVTGMRNAVFSWQINHSNIFYLHAERFAALHWRSDGSVDARKTAESLVLDESINIKRRFEIACAYCFEKRIQALWADMKASGEAKTLLTTRNPMERFWIRWLHSGAKMPWTKAVCDYLELSDRVFYGLSTPKFSAFFPLLLPEDRQKFLPILTQGCDEDFRFCLYASTGEEQREILKSDVVRVLVVYLCWPLQNFFLETVEKMWNYIDVKAYLELLGYLLYFCIYKVVKDYDYSELFSVFWNRSPNHFKDNAKKCPRLNKQIDFCFKEIERERKKEKQRKVDNHEQTRPKKRRVNN